jgi:hypothetical protein
MAGDAVGLQEGIDVAKIIQLGGHTGRRGCQKSGEDRGISHELGEVAAQTYGPTQAFQSGDRSVVFYLTR